MEDRVRAAIAHLDLSREAAEKHLQKADHDRAAWVRGVYEADVTDPALYDLVLNLGTLSMETATEMVVDLLGRPEYRSTPDTLKGTRDFSLGVRLEAECPRSKFPEAASYISVSDGVVTLELPDTLRARRDEMAHFVGRVDGVKAWRMTEPLPMAGRCYNLEHRRGPDASPEWVSPRS